MLLNVAGGILSSVTKMILGDRNAKLDAKLKCVWPASILGTSILREFSYVGPVTYV